MGHHVRAEDDRKCYGRTEGAWMRDPIVFQLFRLLIWALNFFQLAHYLHQSRRLGYHMHFTTGMSLHGMAATN